MNKKINIEKNTYTKPALKEFGKMRIITQDNMKSSSVDNISNGARGDNMP